MLERINLRFSTNVITVSKDMVELLNDINIDKKPKIIHTGSASGLEVELFSVRPYNLDFLRKKYGLNKEDTVVVYAGRSEKRKGVNLVLRLWMEHFQSSHYSHFKLITCGPDRIDLEKIIDVPLPKNVIPLGFIDNISEVLFISDAIILPSLHEGLSYVCMEAQASGVLVIANDIRGIRCLVNDQITGFLVKENNLTKYAEIISNINKEKNFNFDMKKKARNNVEQYSRKNFMPEYLSFLLEISNKN
jgi:glycosyltransferase involved in cell wall biosynthesis